MTATPLDAALKRLATLSRRARAAQAKADHLRAERDAEALRLQRLGATYPQLAAAIGNPEGTGPMSLARITQVLRAQRRAEADRKARTPA